MFGLVTSPNTRCFADVPPKSPIHRLHASAATDPTPLSNWPQPHRPVHLLAGTPAAPGEASRLGGRREEGPKTYGPFG
jgi:hypothetical protein